MNEDRHIILDNEMNMEPQEGNIQEVTEVVETPKVEQTSKPKKEINGAVVLFILIGIVVLGSTLALFVIPLIFVKEVEPGVQENIALSVACSNVDNKGNYEIENVKCKDYVCTLNDKGKEKTKKCATPSTRGIEDPEATLNEEEIDNLVDIDG
jgi:hypothetical protein